MLFIEKLNLVIVILLTIIIVFCSLGIILSYNLQRKQKKKYKECLTLIKERENGLFQVKNGLSNEDIKKIDKNVNVDKLGIDLYNAYLDFITCMNNNDINALKKLTGFIKKVYENKLDILNQKKHNEIIDGIDLNNYSILEYSKTKIKFRVNIYCFSYKKNEDIIISGSNLEKIEQTSIITFEKVKTKWYISNIEKVYENKISV